MRLGYICTNYNNSQFTVGAIRSLLSSGSESKYVIVVVDNNSDPEQVEVLVSIAKEYNNVHVILNGINLGYFSGLNVGIKYMRENYRDVDHIIIGNNDLVFPDNFYESIIYNLPTLDKFAVISPNIVTLDGIQQNPYVIKSVSKLREFAYEIYYSNYYFAYLVNILLRVTTRFTDSRDKDHHEVAQTIFQGHGSCYILCPLFFENFSELYSPSFLMGEEFFLSVQLMSKSLHIYYEPSIKVAHYCNGTMASVPDRKKWEMTRDAHKIYRTYVKIFSWTNDFY